jgi:sugar O-acyltransferase (sialic acid O-acetyltransferase NeuD family)
MNKLAILGASGHGKVVADIALVAGWAEIFFFDDAWPSVISNGIWDVIGNTSALLESLDDFDGVIVAIGDCNTRWKKQQIISSSGGQLISLIHPTAIISSCAKIGVGVAIMASAVVNVEAVVGDGCIINSGAIIEHDSVLGNAVHVSPGAVLSGSTIVGERSLIGVGAVTRQGVLIGDGVTVGAGAVVLGQVQAGLTVVGCPASQLLIVS